MLEGSPPAILGINLPSEGDDQLHSEDGELRPRSEAEGAHRLRSGIRNRNLQPAAHQN